MPDKKTGIERAVNSTKPPAIKGDEMKRTKIVMLGVLGLLFVPELQAQEHAPAVDVCRADAAVWGKQPQADEYLSQETKHLTDGTPNSSPIAKLSLQELILRSEEMNDCERVDEPSWRTYQNVIDFYHTVIFQRYHNFIIRHHLLEQFKAEDAAGIR